MEKKIALITGATSGIGEATALSLARMGYNIIATGRRQNRLEALAKKLKDIGVETFTLNFDVRDQIKVQEMIESLPEKWRKIDILINNAGNAHGFDPIQQ
jgi:3-hydroxy acid dehydrogenase / malonic semialdehyde reductase